MDQKDKSPSELITMLHAECSLKLYLRSSVFLRGHFLVQSQGTTPDQFDSFRYIANYRILQNYWEEIARYIYILNEAIQVHTSHVSARMPTEIDLNEREH